MMPVTAGRALLNHYKERVSGPRAGRTLARLAASSVDRVDALADLAFSFRYRSALHPWPLSPIRVRPLQIPAELIGLGELLRSRGIKRTLEIGTSSGGTLFFWSWLAGGDGMSVSLDLPEGQFAGSQPLGNEGYPRWRAALYRSLMPAGHRVELLKGDSHSEEMLERVKALVGDDGVDFLFIDGDHSYEGVRRDFEMYAPLVRSGGLAAFHDIVERPPHTKCEVDRFWNEVKLRYRHTEFIQDPDQGWGGLGVLFL